MDLTENKKYTGSKMSRLKAMLSVGIMTSALMLTPGLAKDVEAAGKMVNRDPQLQRVYKPSAEEVNRINRAMEKFKQQREDLENREEGTQFKTSGNNFRDSLRIDNPDSEYYRSGSITSNVRLSNTKIHGGNINIGRIYDER